MTLQSVIDIDIDNAKFQRFKDLYDKYQEALGKAPALWKAANKEQQAMVDGFQRMAAAMLSVSQLNRESTVAGEEQNDHLRGSATLWSSIARSAHAVAGSVGSIAGGLMSGVRGLLSFSKVMGVVGGLMGLGGLFGLDKLAGAVSSDRRAAHGLGMGIGPMKAFGLEFGRFIDTDAFLGNQIGRASCRERV